jgi:hypothetical protein
MTRDSLLRATRRHSSDASQAEGRGFETVVRFARIISDGGRSGPFRQFSLGVV